MVMKRRDGDLCKAYRPGTFSDMVGQRTIVNSVRKAITSENHAQCFLFHGVRGCGKTSLARIVAMSLNCNNTVNGDPCCVCESCLNIFDDNHPDVKEIDAVNIGGIDQIRKIRSDLNTKPMFGNVKLYIFDEAHRITSTAQEALLKGTEDMPKGVYVILCSTDQKKIIKTLRDRCEDYNFKRLSDGDIKSLIETVSLLEGVDLNSKYRQIMPTIIETSEGRPRSALRALQKVLNVIDDGLDWKEIAEIINFVDDADKSVIDLCRAITSGKYDWKGIVNLYKKIDTSSESIQIVLAGWFRSVLEKGYSDIEQASKALELFVYDVPTIKPENKLILNLYKVWKIYGKRR